MFYNPINLRTRKRTFQAIALFVAVCIFSLLLASNAVSAYDHLPTDDEYMWVWCYGSFCTQPKLESDITAFGVKNYDFSWLKPEDRVDWNARAYLCDSAYFARTCNAYELVLQDAGESYNTFASAQKAFSHKGNLFYVSGIDSIYDGVDYYDSAISRDLDGAMMQDMKDTGLNILDEFMSFKKSGDYVSPRDLYLDSVGTDSALKKDKLAISDFKAAWSGYLTDWWNFVTTRKSDLQYDDECRKVVEEEGTGACNRMSLEYISRILRQTFGIVPVWTTFNERLCTISVCLGSMELSTNPINIASHLNVIKEGTTLDGYFRKYSALYSFASQAFREEDSLSLSARTRVSDFGDEVARLSIDEQLEKIDDGVARWVYNLSTVTAAVAGGRVQARQDSFFSPKSTLNDAGLALDAAEKRLDDIASGTGDYSETAPAHLYHRISGLNGVKDELERVNGSLSTVLSEVESLEELEDTAFVSKFEMLSTDSRVVSNSELSLLVSRAYSDFLSLQEEKAQPHARKTRLGERILEKQSLITVLMLVEARADESSAESASALKGLLMNESGRVSAIMDIASSSRLKSFPKGMKGEEVVLGPALEDAFVSWKRRLITVGNESASSKWLLTQYTNLDGEIQIIEGAVYQKVDSEHAASVNQLRRELSALTDSIVEAVGGSTRETAKSNALLKKYDLARFASGDGWISAAYALGFMRQMRDEFASEISALSNESSELKRSFFESLPVGNEIVFAETPVANDDAAIDHSMTVRNPSAMTLEKGDAPITYAVSLGQGRHLSRSISSSSMNVISKSEDVELVSAGAGSTNLAFRVSPPFNEYSSKNLRLAYFTDPVAESSTLREESYASSSALSWTLNSSLKCTEDLDAVSLRLASPFNLDQAGISLRMMHGFARFAYEIEQGKTLIITKMDGCRKGAPVLIEASAVLNDPIRIADLGGTTAEVVSATKVRHDVRFSATNTLTSSIENVWIVLPAVLSVQPASENVSLSGILSSSLLYGEEGTLSWVENSFKPGETKNYRLTFTTSNLSRSDIDSLDERIRSILDDIVYSGRDCTACCNVSATLNKQFESFAQVSNASTVQELADAFSQRLPFLMRITGLASLVSTLASETMDLAPERMSTILSSSCSQDFQQALKDARAVMNEQQAAVVASCKKVKTGSDLAAKMLSSLEDRIERLKTIPKLYPSIVAGILYSGGDNASSATTVTDTPSQLETRAASIKQDALTAERDCDPMLLSAVESGIETLGVEVSKVEESFSKALFYFTGGDTLNGDNSSKALTLSVPPEVVRSVESNRSTVSDSALWEEILGGSDVAVNQEFLKDYQSGDFDAAIAAAATKEGLVRNDYASRIKSEARIQLSLAETTFNKLSKENAAKVGDYLTRARTAFNDGRFLDSIYLSLYVQQNARKLSDNNSQSRINPLVAVLAGVAAALVLVFLLLRKKKGAGGAKIPRTPTKKTKRDLIKHGTKKTKTSEDEEAGETKGITVHSDEFGEIR